MLARYVHLVNYLGHVVFVHVRAIDLQRPLFYTLDFEPHFLVQPSASFVVSPNRQLQTCNAMVPRPGLQFSEEPVPIFWPVKA